MLTLTPVVLLPLAAVLINDVKTENQDGALTVQITTTDPVATSDIRVSSGGARKLYVYVDGSAARRPSFGEGEAAIVAHARLRYTKLEIPTPERCGEPIGVVATADGVRVRATCRDASAGKASVSAPVHGPAALDVERPLPNAPRAALADKAQAQAALRAALALPREPVAEEAAPPAQAQPPATAEPAQAKVNPTAEVEPAKPAPAAVPAPAPAKAAPPDAPAAAVVNQDSTGASVKGAVEQPKSGGSVLPTILGVVLLLGVGAVAVVFARRRGGRERLIRIVETASIGPRRSLVVACVGGRTMVLGVSEAGVSLLDGAVTPQAAAGTLPAGRADGAADAAIGLRSLALAATSGAEQGAGEQKQESSLLGRLFHRKSREAEGLAKEDFEQLFAESLEDEELRRKLAMGQSGRIA